MSVHFYRKKRSLNSYIIEKYILPLRGTKKAYSTPENAQQFLTQQGNENTAPYLIEKINFSSGISEQEFEGMQVFILNDRSSAKQKVILYLHGGGWTCQPERYHWLFLDKLAQETDAKIIAPVYPKTPNFNYMHTYPKLLNIYEEILEMVGEPAQITLMGDSAGGNICLVLAHLFKEHDLPQPKDIILLAACVDMNFDNPLIPLYEERDPMLASGGMDVITSAWAGDKKRHDPLMSPVYSELEGLAKISHFIGTHDILYPDAVKFDEKLTNQGLPIDTFVFPRMNHVFVVMPIPEAKAARRKIIEIINS
ncbi:alpha/beta hydrolase [Evansella sp. LMS18]|uniref:alpha/beta hydrolase fold domain-containing protein n=1 Tax=Evansella sp. LMS18 TaxID=2924033 RepID=UPI0020D15AC4|nr:alpha/beta hydrolase [Evansella sp. LMS18]UTR10331.1 alpha/beta hydrolase [Evansella sp. LMS18]